jgi:hypothetical protein
MNASAVILPRIKGDTVVRVIPAAGVLGLLPL